MPEEQKNEEIRVKRKYTRHIKPEEKENITHTDLLPKRKYTRHAKPKKKLLPTVRHQETFPSKSTEIFTALRRAILLDFLEEIGRQL